MKKTILTITLALILIGASLYAGGLHKYIYCGSTGVHVTSSPGILYHVIVSNTAAQENTLNVYDFASNETLCTTSQYEVIPSLKVTAGTNPDDYFKPVNLYPGVEFHYGLYVILASTTSEWAVYWLNENE